MRFFGFCMSMEFELHVFFETNRKQTTNLYKSVFDVFEQTAVLVPKLWKKVFVWCQKTRQEMHALSRIFHLKEAQNEPGLVQRRVKAKDRKHSLRSLFPSVRWSKSRNVSDGLCV